MIRYSFLLFITLSFLFSCKVNENVPNSFISVIDFGADPSGKNDSSVAFQKALDYTSQKVIVPPGSYLISNTIEINKKHLFLEAGAQIFTLQSIKTPVFWLNGYHSILEGENKSVRIKSNSTASSSIIRIGHRDKNDSKRNILYCEIKNLTIEGSGRDNRQTAIHFYNSQDHGDKMTTSYFHNLHNLNIQHVNTGIHLEKWSNANSISNIIFDRVGAENSGCAVWIDGAMENRIYDFFHHHSENALSFRLTENDGRAPIYNFIQTGICEQGGRNARCIEMESGAHNIIDLNCNVLRGNLLPDDFERKKNVILKKPGK